MENFFKTSEAVPVKIEDKQIIASGIKQILTYEQEQYFIDKGGVGAVYQLPGGFCIKILDSRHNSPNSHLFDLGNKPEVESVFQDRMSKTSYNGKTRAPYVFWTFTPDNGEGKNAIIMEELKAVNLQRALNGDVDLPENFSLDGFFDDLEEYIDHMHEVEQIVHTDLYARNIMIDKETGEPRLIDFGRAKDLNKITDEETRKKLIQEDWDLFDETYKKTAQMINSLQKNQSVL